MNAQSEKAVLGGGCFWCTEAVFSELKGVTKVEPGYSGGTAPNPSYEQVCTGKTGHAEVVQVTFDPSMISYEELLRIFFTIHDPTTLNRQGADVGTQYRSIVLYQTPKQKSAVDKIISEVNASGIWDHPIVTQVEAFQAFYPAEEYHRDYFKNNSRQPYCQVVIAPKVRKFREHYLERLKQPSIS
jgi:peptide-methionine (S)-S-oxide reductase